MKLRVTVIAAFCIAALAAPHGPSAAQPASDTPATGAPALCGPDEDCPALTLDAVLTRVLRAHPKIQSLRLAGDRAAVQLQNARGGFDPTLVSGYEYKTKASKDKLNVLRTGIDVPLNLPMSPSLIVDYRRGLGSSVDPSVATALDGETSMGLAIEPLRGLFLDKEQATLDKARLEPRRVGAVQAQERNRLLLKATRAYWKWVEADRKLQISRDLLALAERRQALITRRAEAGEAAAIDSTEAALTVADRRERVVAAEQVAQNAVVKLATFLWTGTNRPADFAFAPPDSIALLGGDLAPRQAALETAFDRRPALRQLELKRQQTQIEARLARGRQRPNLKLKAQVVSYENGPLDVSDVKLGFKIDQPLFFRRGRSEAEAARIDVEQATLKQTLTRRAVRADVDAARADLQQARRRIEAAEERVHLARRLKAAEERRFDVGESTLFLLTKREQRFAKARKSLVAARVDAARAYATYQWATGTIADDRPPAGLSPE